MNIPKKKPTKRKNWIYLSVVLTAFLTVGAALLWFETSASRVTFVDAYDNYLKINIKVSDPGTPEPVRFERVYQDMDCWCWMHYAKQIYSGERFRVRWAEFDNGSYGRPVHWGSPFAWLIVGMAKIASLFCAPGSALAWAGDWISPFLKLLAGTFVLLAGIRRGLGLLTSALAALGFLVMHILLFEFSYGRPDHQSLHDTLVLCSLLSLLNALGRAPDSQKRWMMGAGLAGAMGLWVGATIESVMIAATGISGMALSLAAIERGFTPPIRPEAWRAWGRTGFVFTLVFYVLEYAPHLPMQLEVNHPFYSIAWLAGGELAAQTASPRQNRRWPVILLCMCGICLLPTAILLGPQHWYLQRDPALVSNYEGTIELAPLADAYGSSFPILPLIEFIGFITVLIGTVSILFARPALWFRARRTGILIIIPCLLLPLLLNQIRWNSFFAIALQPAILGLLWIAPARTRIWLSSVSLALALGPYVLNRNTNADEPQSNSVSHAVGEASCIGYIASALPHDANTKECTIFNDPSPAAFYLCDNPGVRIVGSPYWENAAGLRAANEFFAATDWDAARRSAIERKAKYILVHAGDSYLLSLAQNQMHPIPANAMKNTLIYHLSRKNQPLPSWIRPLPIPKAPATDAMNLLLYEIVPDAA